MSSHNDSFVSSGSSPTRDLIFENHGSLFLIRPVSESGEQWLDENVGDENTLTFTLRRTKPPRCANDLLACIRVRDFDYIGIEDVVDRVQTGATVKSRVPKTSRIKPSDLRAQAEKLIADGMMPDLNSLLDAVEHIRTEYQPKILEARRQARIHIVRKTL